MSQIIDFTDCEPGFRDYGGSDSKKSIIYDGDHYMIKFPDEKEKINNLATSTSNSIFSEYIGSHIASSIGLPTQETLLGVFEDEPVVACKDFVEPGNKLQEFDWFLRTVYRKNEIGRIPTYNQIYGTIEKSQLSIIKDEAINRYWDIFVLDALIGNFDRHKGNWGYIVNEKEKSIKLAPIYDCGSSLYPGLSEKSFDKILSDPEEIEKRLFVFPKAALLKTDDIKHGEKFAYHELLNSDIDNNCINALIRISQHIDIDKIMNIVENTPIISDNRKEFYKTMIGARKELIIDRALEIHKEITERTHNTNTAYYNQNPNNVEQLKVPHFIALCGIPGSGKTEYANELINNNPDYKMVSLTAETENVISKTSERNIALALENAFKKICDALNNGYNVVYDAANLELKHRQEVINKLKNINANKELYLFDVSLDTALINCINQQTPITKDRLSQLKEDVNKNKPLFNEGWDKIIEISVPEIELTPEYEQLINKQVNKEIIINDPFSDVIDEQDEIKINFDPADND